MFKLLPLVALMEKPVIFLLTKNQENGNEIWSKRFGGSSYDKANSIIATNDGYLIVGSTSSYGKGNYDVYLIKTDKNGVMQWQNTYGGFFNEYGYVAKVFKDGYLIVGTVQNCTSKDFLEAKCTTNAYQIYVDGFGELLKEEVLQPIKE